MSPIVLAPLELDHEDLAALSLRENLSGHLGGRERGRLYNDVTVIVDQQHLLELHRTALRLAEPLDLDDLARRHSVLLATRRNHRFHGSLTYVEFFASDQKAQGVGPAATTRAHIRPQR